MCIAAVYVCVVSVLVHMSVASVLVAFVHVCRVALTLMTVVSEMRKALSLIIKLSNTCHLFLYGRHTNSMPLS